MPTPWTASDPEFLAACGICVRQRRAELGMDRKALAERAGISYSYLSSIESGQQLPSETVLTLLAGALELSPSELLARANDIMGTEPRTPDSASPDLSPSGAAAEISALLTEMTSEDRAKVLSLARKLQSKPRSERDERRLIKEPTSLRLQQPERRTALYLQFWTMYMDELWHRGLAWAPSRTPEPRSYFTTPSPLKGTSIIASFARNRMLRHELYINRGSREANLDLLNALLSERKTLERAYGRKLEFEDPETERRAVRIAEYRKGHISRVDEHGEYVEWFVDRGERMRRALRAVEEKTGGIDR